MIDESIRIIKPKQLRGPGDFSPPDPIDPLDYCRKKECECFDWEKDECREGTDVRNCIEKAENEAFYAKWGERV